MRERSHHTPEFDAEEVAALAALGWTAPSAPAACPDPSLLLAVDANVLDGPAIERVRAHVSGCGTCRALADDLVRLLDVDPDERERTRIRAQVIAPRRRRSRAWQALGAAGLAAAATIAFVMVPEGGPLQPPAAPAAPAPVLRMERPTVFLADRPAIERAEPELTLRGRSAALPFSERVGRALDAADDGRVEEAERLLRVLVSGDPQSADAHLALGAVLLRGNRAADAVPILERGAALAGPRATEEFHWFLAVALARSGSTTRASASLASLCSGASVRGALACAGLLELDRPARR
jgi:hypothetical protein